MEREKGQGTESPPAERVDRVYVKKVSVSKEEMKQYLPFIHRSETLPKWDVVVPPQPVSRG